MYRTLITVAAQLATYRSTQIMVFIHIKGLVEVKLQTYHVVIIAIAALSKFSTKRHIAGRLRTRSRCNTIVGGSQSGSIEGLLTPPRVEVGSRHLIRSGQLCLQPRCDISIEDELCLNGVTFLTVIRVLQLVQHIEIIVVCSVVATIEIILTFTGISRNHTTGIISIIQWSQTLLVILTLTHISRDAKLCREHL